jgi:hypothetical protein
VHAIRPDRLPYKESDGKGYHSKHLFKRISNKCDQKNLYIHIVRDPCEWSRAMFKKPMTSTGFTVPPEPTSFTAYLKSPWVERVTNTRWKNVLVMRRSKIVQIDEFMSTCKYAERVAFNDFILNTSGHLRAWATKYNLTWSNKLCLKSSTVAYSMDNSTIRHIERTSNESCSTCCIRATHKDNSVQSVQ